MTDPAQTKQDPLAALEEVLKNSDPASQNGNQQGVEAPKPNPAEQAAAQQKELAELKDKHQKQDEDQLRQQLDALHKIAEKKLAATPPEAKSESSSAPADDAGYEINQLGHTKIKKDQ